MVTVPGLSGLFDISQTPTQQRITVDIGYKPPLIPPPPPPPDTGCNTDGFNSADVTWTSTYHNVSIRMAALPELTPESRIWFKYKICGSSDPFKNFGFPYTAGGKIHAMDYYQEVRYITAVGNDVISTEWRGSLLKVASGVTYHIQIMLEDSIIPFREIAVTTKSEIWTVDPAKIVDIPCGPNPILAPIVIQNLVGSPDGWVLVRPDPNIASNIINGSLVEMCMQIGNKANGSGTCKYIIFRGFKFIRAKRCLIGSNPSLTAESNIPDTASYIIFDDCDFSEWGTGNFDGGVPTPSCVNKDGTSAIVLPGEHEWMLGDRYDVFNIKGNNGAYNNWTIQRCKMHDPLFGSNDWSKYRHDGSVGGAGKCCDPALDGTVGPSGCHPKGPHGIFVKDITGLVIRYNEFVGTPQSGAILEKYWNDCIDLCPSDGDKDGFSYDSDIYGNLFSGCWDDMIQADSRNQFTRIYENYITETNNVVSHAPILYGPSYLFENIVRRTKERRTVGYKTGNFIKFSYKFSVCPTDTVKYFGRIFAFNNTFGGPDAEDGGQSLIRSGGACVHNVYMRNNIGIVADFGYDITGCGSTNADGTLKTCGGVNDVLVAPLLVDIDYDLVTASWQPTMNASVGAHTVVKSSPSQINWTGDLRIASGSGKGDAIPITGLDGFDWGASIDRGALQTGQPDFEYGVNANLPVAVDPVDDLVVTATNDPYTVQFAFTDLPGITTYEGQYTLHSGIIPSNWIRLQAGKKFKSTGLSPNTSYDFAVRGVSGAVATDPSNVSTATVANFPLFTDGPTNVPTSETSIKFTGTLSNNATLYWGQYDANLTPSRADIEAGGGTGFRQGSSLAASGNVEWNFTATGVETLTVFTWAFVAKTAGGVYSEVIYVNAAAVATEVSDNFNRADGNLTPDPKYSLLSGVDATFGVVGNALGKVGANGSTNLVVFAQDLQSVTHVVEFDAKTTITGTSTRVVAACAGLHIHVGWCGISGFWELIFRNGSSTPEVVVSTPQIAGDLRMRIEHKEVSGVSQARLLIDGNERIAWTNTNIPAGTMGGYWSKTPALHPTWIDNVRYGVS